MKLDFSATFPGWDGAEEDEGIEVLGPVEDICRKAGISQATYLNWKKKYDGMLPPDMRRLRQLEDENTKLRKLAAEFSLDREMLQDVRASSATSLSEVIRPP